MPRPAKAKPTVSRDASTSPSRKAMPEQCWKCAMLSANQAQALHGVEGDGCWNPAVCHSRRSYARHRDRRNQVRRRKHQQTVVETLSVDSSEFAGLATAILVIYRKAGAATPVHAISAEIWQGQERCAVVAPLHCLGMVPS